jgi:BirA family biotin operon repressor/biotin-[acetyl-CoA-carboxylase] ligase
VKARILELLKQNKELFLSGEDISRQIGITRAAVWKYIKQLQSEGYLIKSVSNNGYKLVNCPDILTYEEICENLKTDIIGHKIIHFDSIDSTNNKAKELAEKGEPEGTVIISEAQTSGKGRVGRQWYSQAYQGICLSVILRPNIDLLSVPLITQIACAAICKATIKITDGVQIKWPNDLLLGGRKFCGILTESSGEIDKVNYIIVGIGINVNQEKNDFPESLEKKATSLKIETTNYISRKNFVCDIFYELEKMYMEYKENGIMDDVIDYCRKFSSVIGKQIKVERNGTGSRAKAVDINNRGELLVEFENGNTESISTGNISIM